MNTRLKPGAPPTRDSRPRPEGDIGLNPYEIWRDRVLSPRMGELGTQPRWHRRVDRAKLADKA